MQLGFICFGHFLRWEDGTYDANLACSKVKLTPLKHIFTLRSELNGSLLLSRSLLFYIKSCNKRNLKPSKIWILSDFESTLASTEKTSGFLGEYLETESVKFWTIKLRYRNFASLITIENGCIFLVHIMPEYNRSVQTSIASVTGTFEYSEIT